MYLFMYLFIYLFAGQDLTMLGQLTVAIAFLFAVFQHSDGSFFEEVLPHEFT